jgi:hypothetical protein
MGGRFGAYLIVWALEAMWIGQMVSRLPRELQQLRHPEYKEDRVVFVLLWLITIPIAWHFGNTLVTAFHYWRRLL